LCQNCAKLIDSDADYYTIDLLKIWKKAAEEIADAELGINAAESNSYKDKDIIQFLIKFFDRPAFHDPIQQEGRMEDFGQAIEDTIIALNTGVLRTRDGAILKKAEGKSAISNSVWRKN